MNLPRTGQQTLFFNCSKLPPLFHCTILLLRSENLLKKPYQMQGSASPSLFTTSLVSVSIFFSNICARTYTNGITTFYLFGNTRIGVSHCLHRSICKQRMCSCAFTRMKQAHSAHISGRIISLCRQGTKCTSITGLIISLCRQCMVNELIPEKIIF